MKITVISFALLLAGTAVGCAFSDKTQIPDAGTCFGIDADRNPDRITTRFPAGTKEVYGWFSWTDAEPGQILKAHWYYQSDGNFHILEFPVPLTRVTGQGAVALQMPEGRSLPPGYYRLDLEIKGKVKKSLGFSVS